MKCPSCNRHVSELEIEFFYKVKIEINGKQAKSVKLYNDKTIHNEDGYFHITDDDIEDIQFKRIKEFELF